MTGPLQDDVRTATIAAATRLFAAHGFDGTALQDIADAVGVTKPAILHYFASKEQIRQAVLDGILEHWKPTLPRLLSGAAASRDRFESVFGALQSFFAAEPDRARVMLREALDRPSELRKLLKGVVSPWLFAIAKYVRAGREAGRHLADVDDEAYLLHVLQLVVAASACEAATADVLEGDSRERYRRELERIAKASLFPAANDRARTAGHARRRGGPQGSRRPRSA